MGTALARRLPRSRVPDDEDRRPHGEGGHSSARRVAAPAADRLHRPGAASRDPPLRGPAPHLRRGRRATARSLDAKKAGKIRYLGFTGHKDPHIHLYMLEVAQRAWLAVRRRADAAQRDGRALPQLREARAPRARQAGNWRARHEVHGQRPDSAVENGDARSSACATPCTYPLRSSSPASTACRSSSRRSKSRAASPR